MEYIVIYVEALLVCVFLLCMLFIFNIKNWKPNIINPLSVVYIITIVSALGDTIWRVIDGHKELMMQNWVLCTVYMCFLDFLGFFWFEYCVEQLPIRVWKRNRTKIIYFLPSVFLFVMTCLSPWFKFFFYIDINGVYHRGSLYILNPLITYLYIVAASVLTLMSCKCTQITTEKRRYRSMAAFAIPPFLMSLIQVLTPPGIPASHFGILIALFIVYAVTQENQITRDFLTGLPNRYAFDHTLNEKIIKYRKNDKSNLYLMVGDLDDFKSINDTYGHIEGDRALQCVADVICKVCRKKEAFAARLGGDEFIILAESDDETIMQNVAQDIEERLTQISIKEDYELKMSIGGVKYDEQLSQTEFIDAADKVLYAVKKERKAGR